MKVGRWVIEVEKVGTSQLKVLGPVNKVGVTPHRSPTWTTPESYVDHPGVLRLPPRSPAGTTPESHKIFLTVCVTVLCVSVKV